MLCHHAEVTKDFLHCNHRLCFLQCIDWRVENSPQKVINVNEAQGIGQTLPDSLLSGGVLVQDSVPLMKQLKVHWFDYGTLYLCIIVTLASQSGC